MTTEARLAFNVGLYGQLRAGVDQRAAFVADCSAYFQEVGKSEITYFHLVQTASGIEEINHQGINTRRNFLDGLLWDTPTHRLESQATLQINDYFLAQKEDFIIVWISPPSKALKYPEGRITVYFGRSTKSGVDIEGYGLCSRWAEDRYLSLSRDLLALSDHQQNLQIEDLEQLRGTPILLKRPPNLGFIDYASILIPLPREWRLICSGEPKKRIGESAKRAGVVYDAYQEKIQSVQTLEQSILVGASLEAEMIRRGESIRVRSGCGPSNTELKGKLVFGEPSEVDKSLPGKKVEGKKVFCKDCGACGGPINREISPGFCCPHCGETYLGVC